MSGYGPGRLGLAAVVAGGVLLVLDAIWITFAAAPGFRAAFGDTMLETPRLVPAAAFYLLYLAGLTFFAIAPALRRSSASVAAGHGAALGLVAYGTFDLTTLAILKPYTATLALMDMAWGTTVSAVSATAGAWAALRGARR